MVVVRTPDPYLHRTEERFFCRQIPQRQSVSWLGFLVGGKFEKGTTDGFPPTNCFPATVRERKEPGNVGGPRIP